MILKILGVVLTIASCGVLSIQIARSYANEIKQFKSLIYVLEYMENDKKSGIYDYVLDNDGHGAVLTLTGPGSGLIYMSAGPPVNESALWFIEVNLPQDGS